MPKFYTYEKNSFEKNSFNSSKFFNKNSLITLQFEIGPFSDTNQGLL